ncbi:prophage antirepressor [Thiovulum sp. ES]|nr:prophage antirepressor [Thiovulum sp. ES]
MEIISRTFQDHSNIRILSIKGKEWFVAKDIALLLNYIDTPKAIKQHCKKAVQFKDLKGVGDLPTLELDPQTKLIPESDVWRLIIKSRLPEAEKIEEWIMEEVLPSIRKTGSYSLQKEEETNYSDLISETKEVLQLIDLMKDLSPQELFYLEKIMGENSPTKLLGNSFQNSYFLPTEIGKMVGMSGAEINLILEKKGFQFRDDNGIWRPTLSGKEFCLEIGNQFNQLKWKLETIL